MKLCCPSTKAPEVRRTRSSGSGRKTSGDDVPPTGNTKLAGDSSCVLFAIVGQAQGKTFNVVLGRFKDPLELGGTANGNTEPCIVLGGNPGDEAPLLADTVEMFETLE